MLQSNEGLGNIYQLFNEIFAPLHNVQMVNADFNKRYMWQYLLDKASYNLMQCFIKFQELLYETQSSMYAYDAGEKIF